MEISVKIKLKDKEIELSANEIDELKRLLEKITEKRVIKERECWPFYPWYPWSPITWWEITCDSTENVVSTVAENNKDLD